jgi:predicted nucleic-acid-binding protein
MQGIDTNVLLRYLLDDEPVQSAKAEGAIRAAVASGERLYVSAIVLCELVWVLESGYGYTRAAVADVIAQLLDTAEFEFEHQALVVTALGMYRRGRAGFSDYLIGEISRQHGCSRTLTFDRALRGAPGFEVL